MPNSSFSDQEWLVMSFPRDRSPITQASVGKPESQNCLVSNREGLGTSL